MHVVTFVLYVCVYVPVCVYAYALLNVGTFACVLV